MADKRSVLVLDDDESMIDLIGSFLRMKGFEVATAMNGEDALAIIRSRKIDVALIDVMMPGLDGYHVAAQICEASREEAPKIIVMSGRDMAREGQLASFCGAAGVLQKPFRMAALHAKVLEVLGAPPC